MNRPRLFRGLRIAWSVGFGILCLLLVALWVRSYRWSETVFGVIGSQRLQFSSNCGGIQLFMYPKSMFIVSPKWKYMRVAANNLRKELFFPTGTRVHSLLGLRWATYIGGGGQVGMAFVFAILLCSMFAAVPWLSFRFSLRSLLIAVTLAAVGMGAIVYFVRQ